MQPHSNPEIESIFIAKILENPTLVSSFIGRIEPQHFTVYECGMCWNAIVELYETSEKISIPNLMGKDKSLTIDVLKKWLEVDIPFSTEDLAGIILSLFAKRRSVEIANSVSTLMDGEDYRKNIAEISEQYSNLIKSSSTKRTDMSQSIQDLRGFLESQDSGLSTGLDEWDEKIGKFIPGNLHVVMAPPGACRIVL